MLYEYSRIKSESLAQIHATIVEIQNFFIGDCFLLACPVHVQGVPIKNNPLEKILYFSFGSTHLSQTFILCM